MAGGTIKKFKNEADFQSYLVDNIDFWVKDYYQTEVESFHEQWYMTLLKSFGTNKPRIDIKIETVDGRRIGIEVKNPLNKFGELSRSISQLLAYAIVAEENNLPFDELAIITSEYSDILAKVIKKFNLPIRVFIVTKEYHGELI